MDVEMVAVERNVPIPKKVRANGGVVVSIIFSEGLITPEGMEFVGLIELRVVIIAFLSVLSPFLSLLYDRKNLKISS